MRGRALLLTAVSVVMALLVTTAPVAADHTVLLDTDTNAGDFSAGSNQEVERTGSPAYVGHDTYAPSASAVYRFNNGSGSTAFDHAGSNDGAISGATWTTGARGQALSFDGVDDTLETGVTTDSDGTIAVWANADWSALTPADIRPVTAGDIRFFDETVVVETTTGNSVTLNADFQDNTWTHFGVTWAYDSGADETTARLVVDGTVVDSGVASGQVGSFEVVGGYWPRSGDYFDGDLDDLRVYDEALSPGKVRRLADSPAAKHSPTATERWALDAGQGATAYGDSGTDETIDGGATWTAGISGQALSFDGVDDRILTGTALPQDAGALTYWSRTDYSAYSSSEIRTVSTGDVRFFGNRYLLETGQESTAVYPGLQDNTWQRITLTWEYDSGADETTFWIYTNGTLSDTATAAGQIQSGQDVSIGYWAPTDDYHPGDLDDVRVYDEMLSQADAAWLTNNPGAALPENSSAAIASASLSDGSTVEVDTEVRNTSATVRAVTGGGSTLDTATISADGTATLDISGASYSSVDIEFEHDAADATDPDHYARVTEIRYYFENRDPIIDGASASPNNSETTTDGLPTLSADISDPDFATPQGDRLTATFYVDGSAIGTDSITSNGTVTESLSSTGIGGGTHNWTVVVDDDYGDSASAPGGDGWPFILPSQLQVRDEQTGELIKGQNISVDVRFYSETTTDVRSTSTGNLSMSGLPVGEEFIMVAETDGYYTRRIVVDSLVQQQSVYLLNDSADAVQNNFILQDYSSRFDPATTKLIIEKVINDTSTTDTAFRTIAGDYFGSAGSGFPVVLEQDARYRLKVINDEGEVRDLGAYTAAQGGDQPIRLGQVKPPRPDADTYVATVNTSEAQSGDVQILFAFTDPEEKTTNFDLTVHPAGQPENPVYTDDWNGPRGDYLTTVQVPDDSTNYVVNWTAERNGNEIGATKPVGGVTAPLIPVDSHLLAGVVFIAIVFLLAQAVPQYGPEVAMTTTSFAGVMMALQVIDINPFGWWAAAVISVGLYLGGRN